MNVIEPLLASASICAICGPILLVLLLAFVLQFPLITKTMGGTPLPFFTMRCPR